MGLQSTVSSRPVLLGPWLPPGPCAGQRAALPPPPPSDAGSEDTSVSWGEEDTCEREAGPSVQAAPLSFTERRHRRGPGTARSCCGA